MSIPLRIHSIFCTPAPVARLIALALLISNLQPVFAQDDEAQLPGLNETTFSGLEWRGIGPALMSGRISDIVIDPTDRGTWYVAVGSGGVWKTENSGVTWTSLFDGQGSYSIGAITLDPNNPNTVWVGTGENVGGRHVGYGDGIYRSLDGGKTWENMGLANSEHIGMIRIDPRDSNVIFVASQGPLWSKGGDRGLFRSSDGGATWEKVLGGGPYTGVNEVHFHPNNPDILIASTHQRFRNVPALMNTGPESGIHKSTDGGESWREVTNGLPSAEDGDDMGKIGLAFSPIDPDVVYAGIELGRRTGGFWRSTDGGESWEKRSDYLAGGTGPHYYQEIFADPHKFDRIYHMDATLHVSIDGGKTFLPQRQGAKHGDHHAMAFDPNDPDHFLMGTDGGVYETWDLGETYRFIPNLSVTQFYKVAVDYDEPFYNIYGGTQDNNTQGGPSRTDNVHGIRSSDWFITLFGDGHQPAVDPTNPDIVYSQWQQANLVRFDRKTGEFIYIQPQPEAGEDLERWNWDSPILISPFDPARLYFGSQRVWRSDDRGDSWRPISGDLTRDVDRLLEPMMDRVHSYDEGWDIYAMSMYSTITSLSESPLVEGLLYVGTDDGRIQVTEDGGENWRSIDSLPGVSDNFFVNDIKADLHDEDTVYVVVDDHKSGDFQPYIYKSTNRGGGWERISENLPDRHIVWRLVQDHVKPELMFAGTEFGVFFTIDGGERWTKLAGAAPTIPFRDLVIQTRENDLVGATFGRGFWILDDYTPLRDITTADLESGNRLFPVRDAKWYLPRMPLGDSEPGNKASQGDDFFIGPNPPFGAVFTYYLAEGLKSDRDQRRESEIPLAAEGGDTPFPGWDVIRDEDHEESPAMVFTVRDSDGNIVQHVEGSAEAGFHRVAWDLRYPETSPWQRVEPEPTWLGSRGPLAMPGEYTVTMASRIDGRLAELDQQQTFNVVPLRERGIKGAGAETMVAFSRELDDMRRQTSAATTLIGELLVEIDAIKSAQARSTAPQGLRDQAEDIRLELLDLQLKLVGDPNRQLFNEGGPVPISRRLFVANMGTSYSTYGPTPTHRRSLEIASDEYSGVAAELEVINDEKMPALRNALDEAGVPWTPGRD
ncbi:MAG TPA: hypothetical protein VJ984_11575 [Xanthomonadales bacterium]|nr:hypothetical protein [Xanthomonadales bacterium]